MTELIQMSPLVERSYNSCIHSLIWYCYVMFSLVKEEGSNFKNIMETDILKVQILSLRQKKKLLSPSNKLCKNLACGI